MSSVTKELLRRLHSAQTGRCWQRRRRIRPHGWSVLAIAFSPNGTLLATTSEDKAARVWEVATGYLLGPPLRHQDVVEAVAFSPDGRFLATASWDNTARLWTLPQALADLWEMELCTWVALGTRFNTRRNRVEAIPWQEWQGLRQKAQMLEARRN